MRAPRLTLLFKAAVGVMAVTALAACATTKDEPAAQVSAAQPPSLTTAPTEPEIMPARPPVVPGSLTHDIGADTPDRVYFEYDNADLSPEGMVALQKQAAWLQRYPTVTLVIEGHSDERGTREYNLALAARRAVAVRIFLMTNGVSAARLETVSYGKERPSCTASGDQCWRLNRRAVSTVKSTP